MAYTKNKNPNYGKKHTTNPFKTKKTSRSLVASLKKSKSTPKPKQIINFPTKPKKPAKPITKHSTKPVRSRKTHKSSKKSKEININARSTIITVIVAAMAVVVFATFIYSILTPENYVKTNVENIAKDYYENYFYDSVVVTNRIGTIAETKSIDDIMTPYTEKGLPTINLEQLLLYDNQKYASLTSTLAKYCNLKSTTIKFYPESPFDSSNYHFDVNYSCDFDK